jgi:ABC-type dipeptide/oligopeptide/nickel transport system permease subunit
MSVDVQGSAVGKTRDDDSETPRQRIIRRFRHNVPAMFGLGFLVAIIGVAVFAPLVAGKSPDATDPFNQGAGPSTAHWLGTDLNGRDAFARLVFGTRVSLEVCVLVVIFAMAVALPLGLIAGYFGGAADYLISRFTDAMFTFPTITLALIVAVIVGKGILSAAIAIGVTFVPGFVRLLRAQVLAVREEVYVEAARSVGVTNSRMLRRHILPNAITPLLVQIALSFGYALLAEAGLSFLGFGVQQPTPSWGTMLQDAYNALPAKTWPVIPPGIALALTVLAINLVADGLRDSLGREAFSIKVTE